MEYLSHPIEVLSASLHHAAFCALPDLEYEQIDSKALYSMPAQQRHALQQREREGDTSEMPMRKVVRRPTVSECQVLGLFPQLWGSTALGFGGIGGAAMTYAYTCVVRGPGGAVAVYWSGDLGYVIPETGPSEAQRQAWEDDLLKMRTVSRSEALSRYGAVEP